MELTRFRDSLDFRCTRRVGPDRACGKLARWVEKGFTDDVGFVKINWSGQAWCDEHRPT